MPEHRVFASVGARACGALLVRWGKGGRLSVERCEKARAVPVPPPGPRAQATHTRTARPRHTGTASSRAPVNTSAPLGEGGGAPPPPPPAWTHPPTPKKDWAKFSSGPLAYQKFSLAPIGLDQKFSVAHSAPLNTPHHLEGRGGWMHSPERPPQQPAQPQFANHWAPLMRKRHLPPHSAQPPHTNDWAPRTRKRHQQEHRPQRPTERSDPTQHAKGRTGDCRGPRKGATTRRNVTRGRWTPPPSPRPLKGALAASPSRVCPRGARGRSTVRKALRPDNRDSPGPVAMRG